MTDLTELPSRPKNARWRTRRTTAWLIGVSVTLAACSGGGSADVARDADDGVVASDEAPTPGSGSDTESDDNAEPSPTASTVPVPTTLPRPTEIDFRFDPDTGELVEVEVEVAGPATFDEVIDFGIEAGLWGEVEGLERVLGYAVGAVPAEQVPGVEEILSGELDELLRRANSLALSGDYTDDELAQLKHWYELAVPSDEVIAMLVTSAGGDLSLSSDNSDTEDAAPPNAADTILANTAADGQAIQTLGLAPVQAQENCVPVDPDDFSGWAVIEGCYEIFEDVVNGVTLRVLYPAWYNDDPELAMLPLLTREALAQSVSTYSSLGKIGDMSVIFSLVDTAGSEGTLAVANHTAQWKTATVAGACPITVFPAAFTGDGPFQQTIAHEAWHCVQRYSGFPEGIVPSGTAWFIEAGAEYFSNVVYPSVNDEHDWLEDFDRTSRTMPLFSMSYEAWIWWQFLANRQSPRAVADLHVQMMQAGDGGTAAMEPYGDPFQRFVVEFTAGAISDANGSKIPPAIWLNKPNRKVAKGDANKVLEFAVQPFVAARFVIEYDKELRVFESDQTATDGEVAMADWDSIHSLDAWKQVFPEVRSKCKSQKFYILVATTDQGTHTAKVQIDRIEEGLCDPCVLGAWELDLATFGGMLRAAMAARGGALPPGAFFEFSGHYYTSFDDQGAMREQRDGLVATIGSAEGSISFTVDSFSEGKYTADGSRMAAFDAVQSFVNVTTSIAGFGGLDFAEGSSIMGGGAGDYECRTDDMTLTLNGLQPIRMVRVDKILQPPPTTVAP